MMREDDVEILLNFLLNRLMSDYIIFQFVVAKVKDKLCRNRKDRHKFDVAKK